MDRFTITSKEGDLPREYVVRNLHTCPSYDPYSGRMCARKVGLAHKDVTDFKATVKVEENKKTGRLEVTDVNNNRARDELWCDSLLSVTTPLERIAQDIGENNHEEALFHVPQLAKGFVNIREIHAQIQQEVLVNDRCETTRKEIARLGNNSPSWLMALCEDYVLESFTKSLEEGLFFVAFSPISMDSPANDNVKLRLSVMTKLSIDSLHVKQTEFTVRVLEKHVGSWSNRVASNETDEQKLAGEKGDKKKSKLQALLKVGQDSEPATELTPVPQHLRQFSEVAISSINSSVCCRKTYYPSERRDGNESSRPGENWVLLALAYFVESYLKCCISGTEDNMVNCHEQYKVYVSFADYHMRHLIMAKQVPIEAVVRSSESAQAIRAAHIKAKTDARKLSSMVESMSPVSDVKELLSAIKSCAISTTSDAGTTEQAHILKNALRMFPWWGGFKDGTFLSVWVNFCYIFAA